MGNYKLLYKISKEYKKSVLQVYSIWDLYCMKIFERRNNKSKLEDKIMELMKNEDIEKKAIEYTERYFRRYK